jgi:hypothetical protein
MKAVGVGWAVWLAAIAACGVCILPLRADTKAERARAAAKLVADTLEREAKEDVDRADLLKPAIQDVPNCEAARWQSGYVFDAKRKEWLLPDEIEKRAAADSRLVLYRSVRAKHSENAASQTDMARWCEKHRLEDQARAHYAHVLSFAPDSQEARRHLGYLTINGVWVSGQEIAAARQRAEDTLAAFRRRAPGFEKLVKRLGSTSVQARASARQELLSIKDPDFVPAIEAMLCTQGGEAAILGIQMLKNMKATSAAESLAWQAAFSPWEPVRKAAVAALREQRKHDYVPPLLAAMRTPIQARYELYDTPDGGFLMRRALYQDGPEQRQLAVTDLARPGAMVHPGSDTVGPVQLAQNPALAKQYARLVAEDRQRQMAKMAEARARAMAQARQQEAVLATENMTTAALNTRLCTVLANATGDKQPSSPEDWYTWWNDYNEITNQGDKPTKVTYQSAYEPVVTVAQAPPLRAYSCLVAGTPVLTELGPVAVEQIRVGDRVLACDPDTGQIMLKPVLKTIVNPGKPTFYLHTADDKLQVTGGHVFWVAGQGWIKARLLRPDMRFHTLTGTVDLVRIESGEKQDTYNLVVADFHTYFVGKDKILTHDNTIRKPTNCVVPGLTGRAATSQQ